ncbi:hypothetical protein BT93_L2076 [Corymbia citriodora subsp. variegata]|uniref:Phosphate transporter PHO1 n=1 Tax=Corymbia citriodora subsp. variegata TaxID=360336 RepID=A0A8T0CL18_CORYI|nr:hypothetical protein BT93_L2076 [Corymbia citriodora subsp. variegata]
MKFSNELEARLIPEWKAAFVDYGRLKKHVEEIKLLRKPKRPQQADRNSGWSIFDHIHSMAKKVASKFPKSTNTTVIIQGERKMFFNCCLLRKKLQFPWFSSDGRDQDLIFFRSPGPFFSPIFSQHGALTISFCFFFLLLTAKSLSLSLLSLSPPPPSPSLFKLFMISLSMIDRCEHILGRVNEELSKVNQFHQSRENDFLERGDTLREQLQILLDLKRIPGKDRGRRRDHPGFNAASAAASPRSPGPSSEGTSNFPEAPTELLETPAESPETTTEDVTTVIERNGVCFVGPTKLTWMIMAVASMLSECLVNPIRKEGLSGFINRKKIRDAEEMIRGAYKELYRGLGFLRTYSSLNAMAFTKILNKFDKVTERRASTGYLEKVRESHFMSSDKVVRLMDEVESIFTKHFANNDRKMAMKFLEPQHDRDSHVITFFVGLLTTSFLTLFIIYVILIHVTGIFNPTLIMGYVETVYPIFSIFTLWSLHLFMYGCNLFLWKSMRISHNFIFEFSYSTALKYRDAFLICTTFMTATVGAMIIHLLLRANNFSPSLVDTIPGALLLIFFAVLVCPIDIFYHSTRLCFIRVMRNIIFSPIYKAPMVDVFMADQLTSQIPLLRHMESAACYFLAGIFKTHQYETCRSGRHFRELAYVISFLPYYWRAMQCARRWIEERDANHLANMGKYMTAMVVAWARIMYERHPDHLWFGMVLTTSVLATVYQLYWDFVKDWGFLNPKSKNPWLRDELVLKRKTIYYISIALNVVLRVAWVETVMRFHVGAVESRLLEILLASLEVVRRGYWNFYRLEKEHANNVSKFKAVKTVPLPFCKMDPLGAKRRGGTTP